MARDPFTIGAVPWHRKCMQSARAQLEDMHREARGFYTRAKLTGTVDCHRRTQGLKRAFHAGTMKGRNASELYLAVLSGRGTAMAMATACRHPGGAGRIAGGLRRLRTMPRGRSRAWLCLFAVAAEGRSGAQCECNARRPQIAEASSPVSKRRDRK